MANDPMDDDVVHGIEPSIRQLRDGREALFLLAGSIAKFNDNDANAVFFCVQAMQAEVKKLQGIHDAALKVRRRAKGGEGSAGSRPPKGPKGRPKLQLVDGNAGGSA